MVISKQVERPEGEVENIELVAHEADMAVAAMNHLPEAFAMGRQTAEFSGLLIKSGTEISSEAASSVALNVSMVASMFQVDNKEVLKAAHEGETTPLGNVMVAHEGVKEVLKAGWENLKKLFRAAANSVRKLIQTIHSKLFKVKDNLKETSKELKKIKLTKDEDLEINEKALLAFKKEFIGTLTTKSTLDAASLKEIKFYFDSSKDYGKELKEALTKILKEFDKSNKITAEDFASSFGQGNGTVFGLKSFLPNNSKIIDVLEIPGLTNVSVNTISMGAGKIVALIVGNVGTKLIFKVASDEIDSAIVSRLKETKKDDKFVGPDLAEVLDAAAKDIKGKDNVIEKMDEIIKKIDEDVKDAKKLDVSEIKALTAKKAIVQQIASPTVHAIKTNEFERYRKVVAILNFGEAALSALKDIKKKDKKKDGGEGKKETPKVGVQSDNTEAEAKAALAAISDLY